MTSDQSKLTLEAGISVSRLHRYLGLCGLAVDVKSRIQHRLTRTVNHPDTTGQLRNHSIRSLSSGPCYKIEIDSSVNLFNRGFTLQLKDAMYRQHICILQHIAQAGSVILWKDNMKHGQFGYFTYCLNSNNFALRCKSHGSFCLVVNQQANWVNWFYSLLRTKQVQIDYLVYVYQGKIQYASLHTSS